MQWRSPLTEDSASRNSTSAARERASVDIDLKHAHPAYGIGSDHTWPQLWGNISLRFEESNAGRSQRPSRREQGQNTPLPIDPVIPWGRQPGLCSSTAAEQYQSRMDGADRVAHCVVMQSGKNAREGLLLSVIDDDEMLRESVPDLLRSSALQL
jgi:hypothetical protein